jgi:hypothetical protein
LSPDRSCCRISCAKSSGEPESECQNHKAKRTKIRTKADHEYRSKTGAATKQKSIDESCFTFDAALK